MSFTLLAVVIVLGWLWWRGFFDQAEDNVLTPATRARVFENAVREAVRREQEMFPERSPKFGPATLTPKTFTREFQK